MQTLKFMQSQSPIKIASGVLALALAGVAAAILPLWPLVFAELGIVAASLLIILRPEKPSDFRVRYQRKIRGVRPISIRDGGFGLYHPWYFDLRVKEKAERCRRNGFSMALVVLKVRPPDQAESLEKLGPEDPSNARILAASTIRALDLSTALSPLEFAICLLHCDHAGAEGLISRLQDSLLPYECSFGLAIFPNGADNAKDLIEIARSSVQPRALPRTELANAV